MSSNNENSNIKMIATIVGVIVSCIAIFSFITGITTLGLFQSTRNDESMVAETPVYSSNTVLPEVEDTVPPAQLGVTNPSGTIPSGTRIIVEDFSLVVVGNFEAFDSPDPSVSRINIGEIVIQNTSNGNKLFRYQRSGLALVDDLGNKYSINTNWIGNEGLYATNQITLGAGEVATIGYTCSSCSGALFFSGPIAQNADKLFLVFNDFGGFSGFQIEIDI